MHRTLIHIFLDPDIYRRVIILRLRQISCCQIRKQDVERFAALYKRFLADCGGDHIFCDHFFGSGNLIKSNDRHILFLDHAWQVLRDSHRIHLQQQRKGH